MSFAKKDRRRFEANQSTPFAPPRRPTAPVLRVVLLAIVAAIGAAWGLVHHYTVTLPPMRVPVAPRPAVTYDGDAGEIPAPSLEPSP